ncbi:MAG TPA: hypothetical protein VFF21_01505 [Flavobacteriaceae bacterium]|nr:hypothetical protein [Flavobacteriaceae bacterium]
MKKFLMIAALAIFGFSTTTLSAQENNMKIGAFVSLPMGDWADMYGFGAGADFQYLFEVGEGFQVGPMASLMWYSGKTFKEEIPYFGTMEIEMEDAMFLPIGGTARYSMDAFFIGIDLGYGIGLAPSGNDGGLYFKPKVGYNFGNIGAVVSYSGVSLDGVTASSVNLGVEFSL